MSLGREEGRGCVGDGRQEGRMGATTGMKVGKTRNVLQWSGQASFLWPNHRSVPHQPALVISGPAITRPPRSYGAQVCNAALLTAQSPLQNA